jgi:two-component system, NarL family, sensor kinase
MSVRNDVVGRRSTRAAASHNEQGSSALGGLARRLESAIGPEEVLPAVVETIATTLRLPYVAVESAEDDAFRTVASHGEIGATTSTLLHQGCRGAGWAAQGGRAGRDP